jgi:serine/threonine protein kinase
MAILKEYYSKGKMTIECPRCRTDNPSSSKYCNKCASPLSLSEKTWDHQTKTMDTLLRDITRGMTIAGRYEVIEELGTGGMGKVYRVFDREIKEEVALKILNPDIAEDRKSIERFRNELKLSRKIAHKNVCRMYDISKVDQKYFFTMEYVSGENLKSFLKRSKLLTIGTTISIAKQVCEGLSQAHRLGIVHRDLKPSNIMIDREGNVRIMDFGIARSQKTKGVTGSRIMVGTPEYMSPEQAEAKEVDNRSDIYSLGVLLYEIVSGQLPFEGETPLSVILKHREVRPKNPKEIRAQIPASLSQLILKCLEKDKDKRYENVEALLSDLENIENSLPLSSKSIPKKKPITHKEITVSFSIRKILPPLLVTLVIVLLGFGILQILPKKQMLAASSGKPCLGVLYFENQTGDKNLEYLRKALPQLLITYLSPSMYLRILRLDEINSILQGLDLVDVNSYSLENIKDLAKKGGISHIVMGYYIKTGDDFTISATVIDADTGGTSLSLPVSAGEEKNLPANIDQLAKAIRKIIDTPVEVAMEQAIADFGATLKTEKK